LYNFKFILLPNFINSLRVLFSIHYSPFSLCSVSSFLLLWCFNEWVNFYDI
jgi:hypothetical protein